MAQYYLDIIPLEVFEAAITKGPGAQPWDPDEPNIQDLSGSGWQWVSYSAQYSADDVVRVGVRAFNEQLADDDDSGQQVETTTDSNLISRNDPITNEYELDVVIDSETYRLVAISSGNTVIGFTFDGAWPPPDTSFASVPGSAEDIQQLDDPQPAPGQDPFPATADPETGDGPIWMWIGNQDTQFNSTPESNLTAAEVNAIGGYSATGRDQIKPVDMDGQTLGGNFQTTFNPTYGIGSGNGGTDMSYVSPQTGQRIYDAHMTTAVQAPITIYDIDENGDEFAVGTFPGVVIQMDNGDVFFRPRAGTEDEWTPVTRIFRIEVGQATSIADNTAIAVPPSLNPDIYEVDIVPCFSSGTLILTDRGEVAIECLRTGDLVMTLDRGFQPIRWIGSRRISGSVLATHPHLHPIRIKAGALGSGYPKSDLVVSPQHRVLVRSRIAQRMFGTPEVLVAAKQLLQIDGIDVADDLNEIEYFHMLFDQHEVIFSNGTESESLYTGLMALKGIGSQALEEVFEIFPQLRESDHEPVPARTLSSGRQARKLAVRHIQNAAALHA